MIDVNVSLDIIRPPSAIAAIMFAPDNDPRWIGGIKSARLLTPLPIGVGTRVERVAYFLGRRIEYVLEIVAFTDHAKIVMQSIKAPFPMTVTYNLVGSGNLAASGAGATRASIRVQGGPKSPFGIGDVFMAPMVRRNVRGDLRRLKTMAEAE